MLELPLPLTDILILLIASFSGSLLTACAGVGGGSLLLVIMASVLPPAALIPIHGLVQLGSNSIRFYLTRKHLQRELTLPFSIGAILATLAGILFFGSFNTYWLPLIVCGFIVWTSWGKLPNINLGTSKFGMLVGGLITTYASLFIGASGPLVSAWIGANNKNRFQYTANFSSCMTLQHSLKLVVFGVIGFSFGQWLILVASMIMCGYLGTKIGLYGLGKLPQEKFKLVFKIVLTSLCIRLLWVSYVA